MKILYHHRIASKDGQYVHIEEITNALRDQGHEIVMVEPDAINQKEFGESSSLVKNLRSKLPSFVHELFEFFYCLLDYLKLHKAIRKHQPDCIYERYNLFFPSGIWAKKRFSLPLLLEVNSPLFEERSKHDHISLTRLANWSEKYVWNNADHVLPVTQVLAKKVIARGVAKNNISVIHNGINRRQFSRIPDMKDAKAALGFADHQILGFTGFAREWHGLDRVLDIISQLEDASWLLLIVGDGPVRENLQQKAQSLGIADKVRFTGIVPRNRIPEYVACFDIALQPDVVEYASPLKLFEYLALGKAILAPDRPNIREVLTDGENAILFDADDNRDFQVKLKQLCDSFQMRQQLGNNALQLVENQNYYWDENAMKIVALFTDLLTRSGSSETVKEAS